MKRGYEDIEQEFQEEDSRKNSQRFKNEKQAIINPDEYKGNLRGQETVGEGAARIKWTEKITGENSRSINPMENLRRRSIAKEEERQKNLLPDEFKYRQALSMIRSQAEDKQKIVERLFERVFMLKEYKKSLQQVDLLVKKNLTDKLKYKSNAKTSFSQKMAMLKTEKLELNSVKNKSNHENFHAENKAKKMLDEICNLKKNEQDVQKQIERMRKQREEKIKKKEDMEKEKRQQEEKKRWEEELKVSLERVKELNRMNRGESLELRILTQKIARMKKKARILAVLVPKESVDNPFLYESYIRVSKHHRALTLVNNPKILEPENHTLHDLDERVGDTELFIQKIPIKSVFKQSLDVSTDIARKVSKGMNVSKEINQIHIGKEGAPGVSKAGAMEEEQVEAGGFSQDLVVNQEQGANRGLLGALKPTLSGSDNFQFNFEQNHKLSSKAREFMSIIKPSPIKVYNNAVLIKKLTRTQKFAEENVTCRFDLIVTNDYLCTYFDNNVILKLYSEIEIFVKSLLYENIDEIFKSFPYDSNQYPVVFNTERQRDDFNCYYHLENSEKKDTNFLLGAQTSATLGSIFEQKLILKDEEQDRAKETPHKQMRFFSKALPDLGKMEIEGINNTDGSQKDTYSIFFVGEKNRGVLPGLLRVLYEDMKSFDNRCIYVCKIDFRIEISKEGKMQSFNFDNFADFLTEFEKGFSFFLYKNMIKISFLYQIGSKLEPIYSRTRILSIGILPNNFNESPTYCENLTKIMNSEITEQIDSLSFDEKIILDMVNMSEDYTVIAEMPHLIKVSKEAPTIFSKIQKVVSFIASLTEY